MREIKFRAWNQKYKEIEYDWNAGLVYGEAFSCVFEDDDRILMQYTGLKDKNGVEIYEGDIVTARHPEDEDGDMDMVRAVVVYSAPSFYAKYIDESLNAFVAGNSGFILRPQNHVIGNIYEHGHLLENKSKEI